MLEVKFKTMVELKVTTKCPFTLQKLSAPYTSAVLSLKIGTSYRISITCLISTSNCLWGSQRMNSRFFDFPAFLTLLGRLNLVFPCGNLVLG